MISFFLMVIHDFDVHGFPVLPHKADSKTIVYPDAMLPGTVRFQSFQLQAGSLEVMKRSGGVQDGQLILNP